MFMLAGSVGVGVGCGGAEWTVGLGGRRCLGGLEGDVSGPDRMRTILSSCGASVLGCSFSERVVLLSRQHRGEYTGA